MRKLLFITLVSWPLVPALADDEGTIVVVASGVEQPAEQTGQPVSVIGTEEIARVQGADLTRIVERLPGVTLTRNGGLGSFTGLRVRGAEAEQLLVLVDGVRVADTAAPAGGFDFGTLLPAGIAKIELLRGSNSTIWGSQAMGGVLAVETDRAPGIAGSLEYGGPEAVYAQALASDVMGPLAWGVDGAFYDDVGESSAANGTERDGLRQWQAGARARLALGDRVAVRAVARHTDALVDLDGFPAPNYLLADTAEYQDTRRTSGAVGADYLGDALELRATYSLSHTERDSLDRAIGPEPTYTTQGRDERAEVRGKWAVAQSVTLHFGAERDWSRMETLFDAEQRTHSSGAYAQAGYARGGMLLNAGVRIDDHERFGSAWTFGADGAVALGSGWRVRGSYGEGFKAPTLFQLLSDYGNLALSPERSRGFDLGVEKGDRNAPLHFAASLFRRDSTNLIDFDSCFGNTEGICEDRPFGTYDNIGKARAQGGEIEAGAAIGETLRVQGVYSYVEAENRAPGAANEGNTLARRPRHAATLSADWESPWSLRLGADVRVVSASFDDAANTVRLGGYEVVTLRAEVPLTDTVEIYGRVENLFDDEYQTAAGYDTQGRAAYVGARARW
jgi:vitamin B12 transporter